MALESATYLSQLVSSNPASSDQGLQGDDHIRLIKAALQATFPNHARAYYPPGVTLVSSDVFLVAADEGKSIMVDANAAARTITMPGALTSAHAGWSIDIFKYDSNSRRLIIVPFSGTINGQTLVQTRIPYSGFRVVWTGSSWLAIPIGENKVPGTIADFAVPSFVPPGWMYCDGSLISRTTYAILFNFIGTTFGAGDGSTTFAIPDNRGRVRAGRDDLSNVLHLAVTGGILATAAGNVGGVRSHTLSAHELASHSHTATSTATAVGDHTHSFEESILAAVTGTAEGGTNRGNSSFGRTTNPAGGHNHTIATTIDAAGGSGAHNNIQPTIIYPTYIWTGLYNLNT